MLFCDDCIYCIAFAFYLVFYNCGLTITVGFIYIVGKRRIIEHAFVSDDVWNCFLRRTWSVGACLKWVANKHTLRLPREQYWVTNEMCPASMHAPMKRLILSWFNCFIAYSSFFTALVICSISAKLTQLNEKTVACTCVDLHAYHVFIWIHWCFFIVNSIKIIVWSLKYCSPWVLKIAPPPRKS